MGKWEMVRLGDVVTVTSGGTPQKDKQEYYENGTIPWVKTGDLKTKDLYESEDTISEQGLANSSAKIFPVGTVLLAMYGATIGACSILKIEASTNQACAALLPCDSFSNTYLYYYFASIKDELIALGVGGAQPNISATIIKNLRIPLPPLPVQQQIANVLDRASALIEKRKTQIIKLDLLVKSQFIEMFGDPVTNPMGWEVEKFEKLGELNRGVSKHRPRNDPKLLGGEYPLIQTGDVANAGLYITSYTSTYSEAGLKQSKMWPAGTLCITIAANIAKTSVLNFNACFPDSVVGFLSNKSTNVFFIHYWFSFLQKLLEEQAPESAQKNINLKILSGLDIICPPAVLQNDFAAFVLQAEAQKSLLQKSLAKLEQNYKSLMQKCFRGELF